MMLAEHEVLPLTAQIQNTLNLLDEIVAAENSPDLKASVDRNKRYAYSRLPGLAIEQFRVLEIKPVEIIIPQEVPEVFIEEEPSDARLLFEKEGFWEEFLADLSQVKETVRFNRFLFFYYLGNPMSLKQTQPALGKYRSVYPELLNLHRNMVVKNMSVRDKAILDKKPMDILYDAAPDSVRIVLVAKFPQDFRLQPVKNVISSETLISLDSTKQKQIISLVSRMAELRFNPLAVSQWDFKKEMIGVGLAERNRTIFEREYAKIQQLQKEGVLNKGENLAVELAAMVTFTLATSKK